MLSRRVVVVDACASSPCQNNATCETTPTAFRCHCPPDFLGDHCETYVAPSSQDVMALVAFPVILAAVIVLAVVVAVVICQCRYRKQAKLITRDNANDMSYFGFTSGDDHGDHDDNDGHDDHDSYDDVCVR